jgi:hypothetical protein
MSLERLAAIERQLVVVQILVAVNIALLLGVLWLNCTILERLPR